GARRNAWIVVQGRFQSGYLSQGDRPNPRFSHSDIRHLEAPLKGGCYLSSLLLQRYPLQLEWSINQGLPEIAASDLRSLLGAAGSMQESLDVHIAQRQAFGARLVLQAQGIRAAHESAKRDEEAALSLRRRKDRGLEIWVPAVDQD